MITKVLIANRGEIAVRVIRACKALGITSVAVHSEVDKDALHVREADVAYDLGGLTAADSYLNLAALRKALIETGADALHPGYGFLSENPELAKMVSDAGRIFVGPSSDTIGLMGSKTAARRVAEEAGVPVVPGSAGPISNGTHIAEFAAIHGYPVAIKAAYGGGGRGMRVVNVGDDPAESLSVARREALAFFGNDEVFLERYLPTPRHVEVQIIGDSFGNVVWLGNRDCSVQRRHQKLIEEAPASSISDELAERIGQAAVAVAKHVGYANAGTVEFLVQGDEFFFLEMNTRIQVEHPVTEMTTDIDIVIEQLQVAAGARLSFKQDEIVPHGHAIEMRINAEDPNGGSFLPTPGTINVLDWPKRGTIRFDTGYEAGDTVSASFDSLVGKLIVWAPTRDAAIDLGLFALAQLDIDGVSTTAPAQAHLMSQAAFRADIHHTNWLAGSVEFPDEFDENWRAEIPDPRALVLISGRPTYISPGPQKTEGAAPTSRRASGSLAAGHALVRRENSTEGSGDVVSPMQGTVVGLNVSVGDAVELNQVVCVVEAMKMANQVKAQRSGKVGQVLVSVGALVAPGDLLLSINDDVNEYESEGPTND
jgi:acetyl-CoA/propionyl-CoA carboxylase biotin carboxyl carrier protein